MNCWVVVSYNDRTDVEFHLPAFMSRSTIGEGWGYHKFVPVLGRDGTKIAPPGDLFDQSPGELSLIRGKLADHVGDHVVLSPEGVVLVTSPGTESSYPRPPQSFKNSYGIFIEGLIDNNNWAALDLYLDSILTW